MEKFSQRLLRVKLFRNLNIDLFGDFVKLCYASVFNQPVAAWATKCARLIRRRRDCQRVFVILEDQPDDIIDRFNGFVNLVTLENSAFLWCMEHIYSLLSLFLAVNRAGFASCSLLGTLAVLGGLLCRVHCR